MGTSREDTMEEDKGRGIERERGKGKERGKEGRGKGGK
jgi:hypothetical protein